MDRGTTCLVLLGRLSQCIIKRKGEVSALVTFVWIFVWNACQKKMIIKSPWCILIDVATCMLNPNGIFIAPIHVCVMHLIGSLIANSKICQTES